MVMVVPALGVFQACTSREVVGVVVGGMGIQPPTATVYVGDSVQLTAVVQDDRGAVLEQAHPEWTSSAQTVAAVDSNGIVRGLRAGTADVTASFATESASARIVVALPPVFDFQVTESSGSTSVSESGGTDQFTVVLLTQPTTDVVLDVASDDPGEVSVSPQSLVFTASNWSVAQTVTVTGEDDYQIDGDQTTDVTISVAVALSDPSFAMAPPKTVDVLTRDDESPGFTVSSTDGGTSAVEGGASDSVRVVLVVEPDADVHLAVSVDDPTDAAVVPERLTFTSDDWSTPQLVTFSAVDDSVADGTRSRTISVSVEPGSGTTFIGLSPRTLGATTVDDETAGWTVAHTDGTTVATEGGGVDSVSVTLQASPASVVVLDVSVDDPGDATVSPASLIFSGGGPTSQWVTFSAVDDSELDGSREHAIRVSVNAASDAPFLGLPARTVAATTLDDDVAGFTVSESGGVTTVDEKGGTDTFALTLSARPASDVTFHVSSGDLSEVVVAPTAVSFAPDTWSQAQTVTVTGVDDPVGDGDQATEITVSVDSASDAAFAALPPYVVTATTVDDDGIGFTLGETDGTVVNEPGTLSDAIAVRLNAIPLDQVVLTVTSADPGEVTVLPTKLTFTPANAGQPQAVVATGVNDLVQDGDVVTEVTVAVDLVETLDLAYDTVSARSVYVTTLDDEVPNIVVAETGGGTTVEESGTTDVFTVLLSAQPLSNVVLTVSSGDPGEVVADSSTLTFTPAGWSTPKSVTVTGVDDLIVDGDQVTPITLSVDDAASDDAWDAVDDRAVLVTTAEVSASFTVSQSGGSTSVNESGTSDVVTVSLEGSPTSDVILNISNPDPGEVVTDSSTLTFTPSDWSTPKTVTLTGVADGTVDGPQLTQIAFSVDPSSDPRYVSLGPTVVSVATGDADLPGFTVTETGGTTEVDERGSTDTLLVALAARPLSDVVLTVTSADAGEVTVDSATLTFTPSAWNVAKTVTLTGVDDGVEDGDQLTLVTVGVDDGSSDDLWEAVASQSVTVTNFEGTTGFTVSETGGGTSVDETGTTDTFIVGLSEQPASNVVMTVSSGDVGEVAVDSATLTFTPLEWSSKTVTVRGVDDGAVDGPQVTAVSISVVPGSDPAFVGLDPQQVSVTTTDDDLAGFSVAETGGATSVDESGTSDQITVVLSAQPLSTVILTVSSGDAGEVAVDSTTLTFTPGTWNAAKAVAVTGVDDDIADGVQLIDVTVVPDAASDPAFVGLAPKIVSVEVGDDEVADFAVTETGGSTSVTEGGSSDTFEVVLLARPTSSVAITATSPDPSEVTVSPASVSFPPGQWNSPRTFTVTGVNDGLADGDQITLVLVAVDDPSSSDVFDAAPDKTVAVTTTDDEVAGFTVTETAGESSVVEGGATDSIAVVLDAQPVSDVTLTITSGDEGEVTVSPTSVTFMTSNWSQPRQVALTGVLDSEEDGPQLTEVTIAVAAGSDPVFEEVDAQSIIVSTADVD